MEGATGELWLKLSFLRDDEICFEHVEFEVPVGHVRATDKQRYGFGAQVESWNADMTFTGINIDLN